MSPALSKLKGIRIRVACVSEVEGVDGGVFVIGLGIRKNVSRFGCGISDKL
jgi:hypothetical protein